MSERLWQCVIDTLMVCVVIGFVLVTFGWIEDMFSTTQFVVAVISSSVAAFAALNL